MSRPDTWSTTGPGSSWAVPFDVARLAVLGTAGPAVEGVMSAAGNTGAAEFGFSGLGSLVYVPGGPRSGVEHHARVDGPQRDQTSCRRLHATTTTPALPDGQQVAGQYKRTAGGVWITIFPVHSGRSTFDGVADPANVDSDGESGLLSLRLGPGANVWVQAAEMGGAAKTSATPSFATKFVGYCDQLQDIGHWSNVHRHCLSGWLPPRTAKLSFHFKHTEIRAITSPAPLACGARRMNPAGTTSVPLVSGANGNYTERLCGADPGHADGANCSLHGRSGVPWT